MTQIFNRHDEIEKRRRLRNEMPKAEMLLWQRLKGKQVSGYKFRRQFSVGIYVLDFYCPALRLAIEIDGSSHDSADAQEYDVARQQYIEALGIHFLRFTNADIYKNLEGVITKISNYIERQIPSRSSSEEPLSSSVVPAEHDYGGESCQPAPPPYEGKSRQLAPPPYEGGGWGEVS